MQYDKCKFRIMHIVKNRNIRLSTRNARVHSILGCQLEKRYLTVLVSEYWHKQYILLADSNNALIGLCL